MDEESHKIFRAARVGALGGSDIASALGIGDYACPRATFFDKSQVKPDFDNSRKPEFLRGHRLEPVAAAYYQDKTGRPVTPVERLVSKTHPNCAINMDRLFYKHGETKPGYLEIKVVKSTFPIRKKGLYKAYILQVQFGCAIADWDYGGYAVYEPHGDELLHWDFVAEKDLGKSLLDAGQKWWEDHIVKKVSPPPLPEGSKPCIECPYRLTCKTFDSDEIIF